MSGEAARERFGPFAQLRVAERLVSAADGDRVRGPALGAGDQLRHQRALIGGGVRVRVEESLIGGGEDRQVRDRAARLRDDRAEEHDEPLRERGDRRRVEELRVVVEQEGEPVLVAPGLEHEVELRLPESGVEEREAEIGEGVAGRVLVLAVQDRHRLEQRRAGGVAFDAEHGEQVLERDVLMVERVQDGAPGAQQQLVERQVRGDLGAQHHGPGEVADHGFELDPVAPGHGRADQDVVLSAVPGQQHLVGGEQHHEERRPVLPSYCLQAARGLLREPERVHVAPVRRPPRPGAVGRQVQDRRLGQLRAPVLQGRVPVAVPVLRSDVGVLDEGFGQRRGGAVPSGPVPSGAVQRGQVRPQDVERPAVARDVVQDEAEDVVILRQPDQADAHGRRDGQVEGRVDPRRDQPFDLVLGAVKLDLLQPEEPAGSTVTSGLPSSSG